MRAATASRRRCCSRQASAKQQERDYRLDGLFTPSASRADLPAVVLEAQMREDPGISEADVADAVTWARQP
jgi:hypothetical protein